MQRSQAIMQAVLKNPVLWGGLVTAGFYAAVDAGLLAHPLVARYLAGHWAAYICVGMFFIGLTAIVLKGLELVGQFEALRLSYFEAAPQGQPIGECGQVLAQLDKQPARVMHTYLVERLRAALEYLCRKASTDSFEEELRALADLDVARKHAGYGTVRMMVWAIPFVGSLGTVVGIGAAVANMAPDASGNLLATIVPGLEMVFDTTALALALAVLLMLGMFVCDQIETRLLLAVDARVSRELIGRFKGGATTRSIGGGSVSDGVTGAIEKLIQRQTEMWQASMESANKQWEERTAMLKQELAAGQGAGGGAGAGGGMRGGGGGGGGGGMSLPMSGDAGPWQEALLRSANIAAAQQAELAIQQEIMQQLAEAIGQGSANWPVRRSRLIKTDSAAAGQFDGDWDDAAS